MLLIRMLFCLPLLALVLAPPALGFGVDVCFNDPASLEASGQKKGDPSLIRNCIGVSRSCRREPLRRLAKENRCKAQALGDSLSGLSGTNAIIGGRSLVHSDSTYMIAQLLGFSAWQAYQIMIYDEATDQSDYLPFDQEGRQMLTDEEMEACYASNLLGDRTCLAITPRLTGIYKFNSETGGQLLHLHARFSPDGSPPPAMPFPADYFSSQFVEHELLLENLRAWAFDERPEACAAGVVVDPADSGSACVADSGSLVSPINFFSPGFAKLAINFRTTLGELVIDESGDVPVLSNDASFSAYIPHDVRLAKFGIFLHSHADRSSHHMCTDESYFYETTEEGSYTSFFAPEPCAQGNHFLWHAWEQGARQSRIDSADFRTIEPALEGVWDLLAKRAPQLGVAPPGPVDRDAVIKEMVHVLGIFNPERRLRRMVDLMERYAVLPLPGHGSVAELGLADWLTRAGAPVEAKFRAATSARSR